MCSSRTQEGAGQRIDTRCSGKWRSAAPADIEDDKLGAADENLAPTFMNDSRTRRAAIVLDGRVIGAMGGRAPTARSAAGARDRTSQGTDTFRGR